MEIQNQYYELQNSYIQFFKSLFYFSIFSCFFVLILLNIFHINIELYAPLVGIFGLVMNGIYLFYIRPFQKEIYNLSNTLEIYKKIEYTKWGIQNYEQIEETIVLINTSFSNLSRLKKFLRIFPNFDIFQVINKTILYYIDIIKNLQSSLYYNITKQQESLESAKSEVEKNITGTTELKQVSELQRARLNRQIEQFEELQRVLVKV